MVEEIASFSESLSNEAEDMTNIVKRFKLDRKMGEYQDVEKKEEPKGRINFEDTRYDLEEIRDLNEEDFEKF
jgi:methyl-accepting chemotaxis protein